MQSYIVSFPLLLLVPLVLIKPDQGICWAWRSVKNFFDLFHRFLIYVHKPSCKFRHDVGTSPYSYFSHSVSGASWLFLTCFCPLSSFLVWLARGYSARGFWQKWSPVWSPRQGWHTPPHPSLLWRLAITRFCHLFWDPWWKSEGWYWCRIRPLLRLLSTLSNETNLDRSIFSSSILSIVSRVDVSHAWCSLNKTQKILCWNPLCLRASLILFLGESE